MTRLIAAGALALTAAFAVPASAEPLGDCAYPVDAACDLEACHPEEGCTTRFCIVVVRACLAQFEI